MCNFVQEIKVSQDFLNVLNGHLAYMVSLLLFVFAGLFLEGALKSDMMFLLSKTLQFRCQITVSTRQCASIHCHCDNFECNRVEYSNCHPNCSGNNAI